MSQQIHLPSPCSQNPRNFTRIGRGGFCQSCQKEVVDFRQMHQLEILEFLKINSKKGCGIFHPHQLNSEEIPFKKVKFPIFWALGFLGITGFTFPVAAQTPVTPFIEQNPIIDSVNTKADNASMLKKTIKGLVFSYHFKEKDPLPGAMIGIKGHSIGAKTDIDGYFELEVPDSINSEKITLQISFVGFKTKEIDIFQSQLPVQLGEIELHEEIFVLGEYIHLKPNIWQRFKGIFKSKKDQLC